MRAITLAIIMFALVVASAAGAHEYKIGAIEIVHPWSRATPKGANVAGGYFKLKNSGVTPDRLLGGSTEAGGRFEVHEMVMDGSVMRMRALANGVEIKPGETVEFKPGAFHVMILDLKKPLQQGERFKGTLSFEKAGSVEVEYVVDAIGGAAGAHGH
jgi:periplasmic copper chaperone A